jgi:hypothetical protein
VAGAGEVGVGEGEFAPVVGAAVVPGAGHAAAAVSAEDQATEQALPGSRSS